MQIINQKITSREYTEFTTDSLTLGETLIFNIYIKKNNDYVIIIEAGTILSEILFERLKKQTALYVLKEDEYKQELNAESLLEYIKYNKDNLKKTINYLYEVNHSMFNEFLESNENKINTQTIEYIVEAIIYLISKNKHYLRDTLPYFSNEYSISYHSIHVTFYAIHLGHLLKLSKKELSQIGISSLFHDTGSKYYEDSIKHKDTTLNDEEVDEVHKHPKLSCEIATKNYIHDPYVLDAIMHHHESYDGTGYPEELKKEDISTFASILSICDVFDALTNKRSYRNEYSSFDALKLMITDPAMVHRFNQEYIKIFLHSLSK